MGGHGAYVWASVAALALLVGVELLALRRRRRRALRAIEGSPS